RTDESWCADRSAKDLGQLSIGGRDLADARAHHAVEKRGVQIADRAGDLDMSSEGNLILAACDQSDHAAGLMRAGLGVLMHVHQDGVVQQGAVAFRYGFELGDQISELLYVPAANIAQDALSFFASFARRLSILVGVVVMPRGSMAKPGESRQSLALGQHI